MVLLGQGREKEEGAKRGGERGGDREVGAQRRRTESPAARDGTIERSLYCQECAAAGPVWRSSSDASSSGAAPIANIQRTQQEAG